MPTGPSAAVVHQSIVYSMLERLTRELDPDMIVQQALRSILQLDRWQSVGISLPTPDGRFWQTRAEDRMAPGEVGVCHPIDVGVIGRAYQTGELQLVPDVRVDPDFFLGEGVAQVGSELVIPIIFDGQVIGAINLESAQTAAFDQDDVAFAISISQILAIALKNSQRFTSLQASEARYRQLFETMGQGVVYHAADGAIIDANPAAQRMLGLTLDQLQGLTSVDPRWNAVHADGSVFPGDQHPAMIALRTGRPVRDVVMGIGHAATAEHRWINVTATPLIRPGESRPSHVYTTFDDITARTQAEAARQRSEAELRTVVDCTPDIIFTVDRQLRVQFINRAPPGMVVEQLLGTSTLANVRPEHRDLVERTIRQVFATGQPASYEVQVRGPHDAPAWYATRLAPVLTGTETTQVLLITQDITARKLAEARNRQSEAQYRYLFEHNPHPMWAYDLQTLQFLAVNDAAVAKYGYTRDEFLRMTIADIRPPDDIQRLQENLAQQRPRLQHSGAWRHHLHDGTIIDVDISSHTLQIFDREAALVVAQDITARTQAEAALRASEELYRGLDGEPGQRGRDGR